MQEADTCNPQQSANLPGGQLVGAEVFGEIGREEGVTVSEHKGRVFRGQVSADEFGIDLDETTVVVAFEDFAGGNGFWDGGRDREA